VVPAGAGVIPKVVVDSPPVVGGPRRRGGDPGVELKGEVTEVWSPQARG